MKKLAAIFLFSLFLFNNVGYRIAFFMAQQKSDIQLEASLDKDLYNKSELITIKIPLSLPYQNDQATFERVDGEINVSGKIYKYVKRKIENGNLILMCLPDYNKMSIEKQKEDFGKDVNNVAQNTGSKKQENSKNISLKNILGDYYQSHYKYADELPVKNKGHYFLNPDAALSSAPHSSPEQPPEVI